MEIQEPYNPLHKKNLGISVADALLTKNAVPLPPESSFDGAGIYAIYYAGDFSPYRKIAALNRKDFKCPIYVGKAIPEGARKGGLGLDVSPGPVLFRRLVEHSKSIDQSENLELSDFRCRYLTVDDIWIPLGESLLIEMFAPLWNIAMDGFGNHDPGSGRYKQQKSPWDIIHPGRPWAMKVQSGRPESEILAAIEQHLKRYK
jgi:hypothetical protein